jgi:hypothetical protein
MKYRWIALGILVVWAAPQHAKADVVSDVLGCTGDPCVVTYNPGGEVGEFKAAAREINRTGRRVVIDGPCLSACAILADQARGRVCVTNNAKFGFHKGYVLQVPVAGGPVRLVKRFNPSHSRDIASWVQKNGGYPSRGYRLMRTNVAKRIWRSC